jgi:glycosyltransferase involved in cell wall biosynthesis
LSDDAFIVGTVSRLVAQKAVGDLIDAISVCDGMHLLIVGDGPLREQLEARARPCGRATFLGGRDDVPDILPALDVFVLSSHWEGEPIALLEAMAAQIACVATTTDGSSEILKRSKGGVLVPIGQPYELARALEELRAHPEWRQQVAARGRALACERDWRMAAQRTYAVYLAAITDFSKQTC